MNKRYYLGNVIDIEVLDAVLVSTYKVAAIIKCIMSSQNEEDEGP